MKRVGNLKDLLLSDENLETAIDVVNKSHRWVAGHHPNKKVMYIELTKKERIKELRRIILDGFCQKPTKPKRRYDRNAGKWRDIHEPALWPDQYVHHALIQVIEPVMMRGMDHWCCGSIKGRGAQYGIKIMKKWMKNPKKTKYCAELDIKHFYDNLSPKVVMDRLRHLIKDGFILDLCERILKGGVQIGAYTSQWFANTTLQPMDQMIRMIDGVMYMRYMDNITLFSNRKKTLTKAVKKIEKWLNEHGMNLKENKQIFPTKSRLPNALGYRYGRGYTLIRKRALLTLRREIRKYSKRRNKHLQIAPGTAYAILSRIGRLRHCNSRKIYEKYVPNGMQKYLKNIIRDYQKGALVEWNTLLKQFKENEFTGNSYGKRSIRNS